jgi:hypothetical protein
MSGFYPKVLAHVKKNVAKSIGACKKNPYIINQNHIFSKNYCEVNYGIHVQYVAKSIGACKNIPYVINQNHIFSKNYCEVISG